LQIIIVVSEKQFNTAKFPQTLIRLRVIGRFPSDFGKQFQRRWLQVEKRSCIVEASRLRDGGNAAEA